MTKSDFNKNIAISIIFITSIFFLWKFGILYSYSLFPVVKDSRLHIFVDWSGFMKISECYKHGVNIYLPNECSMTALIYGEIFRYIPYYKNLEKFYFFYIPLTLCSVFIYTIIKLIDRKKLLNIVLLILIIFSPPVLLVLERCNIDLLIFLLLIIMVRVNQPFLSFSIINFVTLLKFYPVALITNFVVERKRSINKNIFIILIFFSTLACLMYLVGESFELLSYKLNIISST